MKTLTSTLIAIAALTGAVVLPLTACANGTFPPISRWQCHIHNQTNNLVAYNSHLGSGNVAPNTTANLSGATISGAGGASIRLNWPAGNCTVKYEENGHYPSTDKNVSCSVNGDDVTLAPTA